MKSFAGKKKSDKAAMSPDEVMSAISEGTEDKAQKKINEDIQRDEIVSRSQLQNTINFNISFIKVHLIFLI